MKEKVIFVVDDDPFITSLVVMRLGSDYKVRSFAYGEDCIAAISEKPDLVILDLFFVREGSTPKTGGEVFEILRKEIPGLPVIILSAQEDGGVVLELARKGITDYVIKDNNLIDNLILSVREILGK